jgi:hypothetical protein
LLAAAGAAGAVLFAAGAALFAAATAGADACLLVMASDENCCRLQLFSRNIYTSSRDKLKIVVLLSRVERDKTLGEIVNSQLCIRTTTTTAS